MYMSNNFFFYWRKDVGGRKSSRSSLIWRSKKDTLCCRTVASAKTFENFSASNEGGLWYFYKGKLVAP